jgi:hypothetical protein
VVILHDLTLALRYATHALLMSEDGLALHGPANEVLTPAQCSRALRTPIIRISDGTHAALIPDGKRHERYREHHPGRRRPRRTPQGRMVRKKEVVDAKIAAADRARRDRHHHRQRQGQVELGLRHGGARDGPRHATGVVQFIKGAIPSGEEMFLRAFRSNASST